MKVTIKTPYTVLVPISEVSVKEFDDDGLKEYLETDTIYSEDELTGLIIDFFIWEGDLDLVDNPNCDGYDTSSVEIVNLEQLIEKYSYLIKDLPKTPTCCGEQIKTNYCPNCGKKLK